MRIKEWFIAGALAAVALSAQAATAYWTGESKMVQSVTGQVVWNCKYSYAGKFFWQAYAGSCPSSVEIQ